MRLRTAMLMISLRPEPLAVAIPYPLASRFLPTFRINIIKITKLISAKGRVQKK